MGTVSTAGIRPARQTVFLSPVPRVDGPARRRDLCDRPVVVTRRPRHVAPRLPRRWASSNSAGGRAAAPRLRVLLIVTSQPPEMAVSRQLVARTLARLSGTPDAVRQHLGPLSAPEVGEILEQMYPDTVVP